MTEPSDEPRREARVISIFNIVIPLSLTFHKESSTPTLR